MLLSQLINSLKKGDAELIDFAISQDTEIKKGASIENAQENQLTFLEKNSYLTVHLSTTNASLAILPNDEELINIAKERRLSWAIFENPKLAFAESLDILNSSIDPLLGIHKTAVIGKGVKLGKGISIGANVCIADNSIIGENTIIRAGVVIYEGVKIGQSNYLHSNCVIHRKSILGNNCIIHSNAVIGSEGFGFIPTKKGWRKMPQTGIVMIDNDVEIGCNSNIDRPSVGKTFIGAGTKIDNLVQIGHGVIIGQNCALAAQVGIAGGAILGNGVILAGQVGVSNRVKVGDGVVATSKCGIIRDIEPGQVISGFPAMPNKLWLRCSAIFKKLPEIAKTFRKFKIKEL
ncbi:UDP-3-O-(3-hydroxymyristoyl)glucosamine N-acyltransferase [Prochlorococcus sp. MIT 1223]|uniref:UDP-3-O-(3-hydroxymyristoyl)glucosamine N-acyltransferase n=1 Tax=Prochlorococcus sp. MIT 1223 TaxID=3096217 RepID=UPI002A7566CF|nr:UDP-3-O-(3-hydroxymyristoyl)glucosamine N-acyltransferase [Prochlorococcus sp. MIT 1223]